MNFDVFFPDIEICWDTNPRVIVSHRKVLDVHDFYSKMMDYMDEPHMMDHEVPIIAIRIRDDGKGLEANLQNTILFHPGELKGSFREYMFGPDDPSFFPMPFVPNPPIFSRMDEHGLTTLIYGTGGLWSVTEHHSKGRIPFEFEGIYKDYVESI